MLGELSAPANNLPAHVSSFIGRASELTEIARLLGESRLITLTGPGGAGKTRLALRAAELALNAFPDGVWLVELAPLRRPELVVETLLKTLRAPEVSDSTALDRLATVIGQRRMLLLLDNCEHLVDECARIAGALLATCPKLVTLATSREPLLCDGERVVRVAPLAVPAGTALADSDFDPEQLLEYDGIHLFVERAGAAEPSFRFSRVTAPAVVEICQRLDGIPLALELAAMRVRGMGVAHLGARLDDRFQLLTTSSRTSEPRQRTLLAAVDWSYDLLSERERVLMRRLGVFVGGFSLPAVEAVCTDVEGPARGERAMTSAMMLDDLTRLVDKSLVQFDQQSGLYRLLETIRQYCLDRLDGAGETNFALRQRFAYYFQLAEDSAAHIGGPDQGDWITRVEQDHDNLRAALAWAIQVGRTDEAARLALSMTAFWRKRGFQHEGLRWLQQILTLDATQPMPEALRPQIFLALGAMAHLAGQFVEGTPYHNEALRLFSAAGDDTGIARTLLSLARQRFDETRTEEALAHSDAALAIAVRLDDQRLLAQALMTQALHATEQRRLEGVFTALERALTMWRALGDEDNVANCLAILGSAYQRGGDLERSRPYLAEAARLLVRSASYNEMISVLVPLHFLSTLTARTPEQALDAARVRGCMEAWERAMYLTPSPWWQSELERKMRGKIVSLIGQDEFERGRAEGQASRPADFLALVDRITAPASLSAHPEPPRATDEAAAPGLTAREREVLRLVAQGLTNAQVARELVVTPRTVNAHLTAIYAKLGVTSRSGAIRYAVERRLV
jgi:predicted ATPase/DNA-binding CsgD family transcriptional regulator